ncbi:formate--tetrahydrofolate ligase [Caldisericum exile]|uniref:Formate--tetrahydrofolate ligase n=1 Tax=Caldisericum exile (strain DSM 21853 / NBRC 104410 / AZM16c01) TaxID=511051 RepID=A0A7U6JH50_CALEA|nr:formate--tetrahydrofolate ligase [Caldisericum exile]BAL81412.1 formate--tetrahydrofolate ligase [Caldisericum exile AZM16c01]
MSDYEISRNAILMKIDRIAKNFDIPLDALKFCGDYIAKIDHRLLKSIDRGDGKLVLITGMTPTPHGEGKTTTTIGLTDAVNLLGYKAIGVIRQPSLGPIFGVKGGATGGGRAQVVPMEEINFLFTGDFPAVEYANNLLSAMIDNSIYQGNPLNLDPRRIRFKRVMDMNDRALRHILIGLGGIDGGIPREEGFNITVASEVMAILGISKDLNDLKERLSNIYVGLTYDRTPVYAKDLKAEGAMAVILRNAINPNLVQTLENNPVFIHTGPFANIAHGSPSIISIKLALQFADYVFAEGGFATDLGGEKFVDIVSRLGNFKISASVIVASIRAMKYHGGQKDENIEDIEALKKGFANLQKHIENMRTFGIPVIVALNKFSTDTEKEIEAVSKLLESVNVPFALSEVYENGGIGGENLAKVVVENALETNPKFLYDLDEPIKDKIRKIATSMYGAGDVVYTDEAEANLKEISKLGMDNAFVCMAKTQASLSDNPKLIGRPENFVVTVKEVHALRGANFIVPILGKINTMPGLPKEPLATKLDIDENGFIKGL